MSKKVLLFLLCLQAIGANVYSQTDGLDFKYGLKLSNVITSYRHPTVLEVDSTTIVAISSGRSTDWLHLIPAFLWQTKKGDFHEVGIVQWQMDRSKTERYADTLPTISTGSSTNLKLGLAYSYSIRFLKKKVSDFQSMVGFEFMPYFHRSHVSPINSTQFPTKSTTIGMQAAIQPHVMWVPTEHLFFDLGLSYVLMDWRFETDNVQNPNVPVEQQSIFQMEYSGFPGQFGIRIGAGAKF